jgi:transcriptional regulator with XRE-family HTH domain
MSSPKSADAAADEGTSSAPVELKAFAGLAQALARLCLRDDRTRKEIAQAAGINASMFSGYLSGRRIPSLEHLDRILTTLGVGIEELTYELRALEYRAPGGPLVLWPPVLKTREGEDAALMLTVMMQELRDLLRAQQATLARLDQGRDTQKAAAPGSATAPRGRKRKAG